MCSRHTNSVYNASRIISAIHIIASKTITRCYNLYFAVCSWKFVKEYGLCCIASVMLSRLPFHLLINPLNTLLEISQVGSMETVCYTGHNPSIFNGLMWYLYTKHDNEACAKITEISRFGGYPHCKRKWGFAPHFWALSFEKVAKSICPHALLLSHSSQTPRS